METVVSNQPRVAATLFILVTVALDVLALGLVIPVLPKLVERMQADDIQSAARTFGLMSVSWALMQIVFSPLLGALSDRIGRRPIVLVSNVGVGASYVIMALSQSVEWLLAGRLLSGMCAATFSTATAYITDITAPERRAAEYGKIGAAFGFGFIAGPAIGGLLGSSDPHLPFWVAATASLANAVYGFFVLPESLPAVHRQHKTIRLNPLGSMRILGRDPVLRGLAVGQLLHAVAHSIMPALSVLYFSYRFGWGPINAGVFMAAVGITAAVAQGVIAGRLVMRIGAPRTLVLGNLAGVAAMITYGLAWAPWSAAIGIIFGALWGVSGAAAQQIMTSRMGTESQGSLSGALSSLTAFGNLVGPLLFTQTFAVTMPLGSFEAGAAHFLAATLLLAAAFVNFRACRAEPVGDGSA